MGRPRILISGPAPPAVGGIASVIQMTLESDLADRYELRRFDMGLRRFPWRGGAWRLAGAVTARGFGFDGYVHFETFAKLHAFRRALDAGTDLAHLHSSHGYDFLVTASMAALARRRGIPVLHHVHGNFDVHYPRWSRLRRRVFRRALAIPDRMIVLSEGWRRWFSAHLDPARFVVLPNPVDTRRFARRRDPRPGQPLRVLFVGTADPGLKGAYDLLAAARTVTEAPNDVEFVCAGRDAEDLEPRLVRGTPLEGHVRMLGLRSRDQITEDFLSADLFVLPSHYDAMPLALLEAMAAGLPIVASAVNSIPETLKDPENAVLVPPRDPDALARALLLLLGDPARREAMGRANRERAERDFSLTRYAARVDALYRSLLGPRPLSGAQPAEGGRATS